MSNRCHSRRASRGTTLIEVLLGLVVLSTLLVAVAVARARFVRQWADADRRLRLLHAADSLIEIWLGGPAENVPLAGRGALDADADAPAGVWRTGTVPDAAAATLGTIVVRLDVSDAAAPQRPVTIDFLLRDARRPATRPERAR